MYVATTLKRSSPRFLEAPWGVELLSAELADAPEEGCGDVDMIDAIFVPNPP
jgi:hypothetical protein